MMAVGLIRRRRVLFAVAAIGAAATSPVNAAGPTDADLVALGRRLTQLRRRCRRLGRAQGESHAAWMRWSRERELLDALCEQIARSPVEGLHGLAIRLEALMTEIEDDDVVLDTTTMRRLRAFSRALREVAAQNAT